MSKGNSQKSASNSPSPPRRPPRPGSSRAITSGGNGWSGTLSKLIGVLFLPLLFAVAGFHVHQRYVVLPNIITTKCHLPRVIPDDAFLPDNSSDRFWGTYRSNLYFGMKTRSPKSPVVGIMWYEQPQGNMIMPSVRHWCTQEDRLVKYGWTEHDGLTFGRQFIEDELVMLKTDFVKRAGGRYGGDWTARITATPTERMADGVSVYNSVIVYLSLTDNVEDGSYLQPNLMMDPDTKTQYVDRIDGYTPDLGTFVLRFTEPTSVIVRSYLAATLRPSPDQRHLKEVIIKATGVQTFGEEIPIGIHHFLGLKGYIAAEDPPTDRPTIVALQITFQNQTQFDVIYESKSNKNRPNTLSGDVFEKELNERSIAFKHKFEKAFGMVSKGYTDFYLTMAESALSNMIGSIGYFYGTNKVQGPYNHAPVSYGPHALFTTVPSRPFFPRGFIWDEGFHHLLIRKFDPELSLEMLGTWLDVMNVEGWIPREMILGAEAEYVVPSEFVVQRDSIANPPMFFLLIQRYMGTPGFKEEKKDYLEKVYPRLRLWFDWLNGTQAGPDPGTYRWRGRNGTTDLELNPKTLPSGLDDYPRASHPTDKEYHLDLRCWMAVSSKVMAELSVLLNDSKNVARFQESAKFLNDPHQLDKLHWSDKTNRYCDYGYHTRHIQLVKQSPIKGPDGRMHPPPRGNQVFREVSREPNYRLVSDTFGYVSLFPLFMRLIPGDSPKLGRILDQLVEPDLLWTPYGLRSLAKTSPLYNERNTEHDPPYWRGSIWINMNYLALSSLKHYSQTAGPHQAQSFKIYSDLRNAVVSNIAREFKRTGYLWEHYNDETGAGEGSHPFTGWTALTVLIMAEEYD